MTICVGSDTMVKGPMALGPLQEFVTKAAASLGEKIKAWQLTTAGCFVRQRALYLIMTLHLALLAACASTKPTK